LANISLADLRLTTLTMPSLRSSALALALAFAAVARADYYIDPDSVPLSKRGEPEDAFSPL
jgi:hypothetical protein